jgi:hypothetical protein
VILIFFSCSNEKVVDNIYSNKIEFEEIFENVSIGTRGTAVMVDLYKDGKVNQYVFEDRSSTFLKDTFELINDSIQFDLKELNKNYLTNNQDVKYCMKYYLKKMKHYHILSITSEFSNFGIPCKIVSAEYEIFYIKNRDSITNNNWLRYMEESNKLDANWYYCYRK